MDNINNEIDNQIIYGMMMKKLKIDDNHFIFSPVHLIKGIRVTEYIFADELGKDYFMFGPDEEYNGNFVTEEEEYCIGFYTTENDLLSTGDILENAKMKFFNDTKHDCVLASYNYEKCYYDCTIFNINDLAKELIQRVNNQDDFEINIPLDKLKEISENKMFVVKEDVIDFLLELTKDQEYDKLIKVLEGIKNSVNQLTLDTTKQKEDVNTNNKNTREEVKKEQIFEETTKEVNDDIDVMDFYEKTRKKIIGQDEAIKNVISAVKMDQYAKTPSERSRCFIVGPTGTGKTEIVKCLGEYLDKPMLKVDTTQITVPGYVGSSLEEYLSRLVSIAGGDIKKAENGIITFDEIDKKCGGNDKLFGQGFLYTLLPFLDGTDYTIIVNGVKKNFNTSNLTVFASGSFSEIIKNTTLVKKPIGFGAKELDAKVEIETFNSEEVFKRASMPEELIGRFPIVVQLNAHTEESLAKILLESDISQLKAEKRKFECLGIDLNWEDKYIEAVAKEAIKLNIGARSLKKIVDSSVKELRWEILTNPTKYTSATLLEETVNNPKVYKLK